MQYDKRMQHNLAETNMQTVAMGKMSAISN